MNITHSPPPPNAKYLPSIWLSAHGAPGTHSPPPPESLAHILSTSCKLKNLRCSLRHSIPFNSRIEGLTTRADDVAALALVSSHTSSCVSETAADCHLRRGLADAATAIDRQVIGCHWRPSICRYCYGSPRHRMPTGAWHTMLLLFLATSKDAVGGLADTTIAITCHVIWCQWGPGTYCY
jgi:hypothetical protein